MTNFPNSWVAVSLHDVADLTMGQSPDSTTYNDHGAGLPFFQGKAEFGRLHPTVRKWCSAPLRVASAGDTLLSVRAPVGPTNVAATDCCIGRGLAAVRAKPGVEQNYLFHYFRSIQKWLSEQGTGTTFTAIGRDFICGLQVPVAPAQEQKRIADKLDGLLSRVEACRDRLDRVPGILKRFRQSILAAAMTGELTRDWRDERGISLDEWHTADLGDVGKVTGGITKNASRADATIHRSYLRVANVYANRLVLDDIASIGTNPEEFERTRLRSGDILIVEGNGSVDQIGRAAMWRGEIADCAHQNHLIRWRSLGTVAPSFALYWLLSPAGRRALIDSAKSTTGLHTLSLSKVSALRLSVPSRTEQDEVVRRVDELFEFTDRIARSAKLVTDRASELTPSILRKAFRGELVPQEPSDEPASALLARLRSERDDVTPRRRRANARA